jgi:hypothetical protein
MVNGINNDCGDIRLVWLVLTAILVHAGISKITFLKQSVYIHFLQFGNSVEVCGGLRKEKEGEGEGHQEVRTGAF